MACMQKLPADTVRLITSSQVITSVVSVIKELIENSLDAGSDNIEVKLENYGFDKIEVRDNGSGIQTDDAPYMAQRHFTSKISQHADLESLATYGFRGEALGSLCAVSSVTIVTKTSVDDFGRQYVLDHGGRIVSSKPSHLGNGTTVAVTHLFKNVPVRRQYYANPKRRRDELKNVEDLVMSYGVIRPGVRFSLSHNKSALWQKSKVANHKAALINTWGSSVMSQMQYVQRFDGETQVRIEGFLPTVTADSQSATRAVADRCWIAVNGRPVAFKELEKMVKQSYCQAVKHDAASVRHLVMFLSVTLPQHHVDVNLEPNKTKVLLQNKDAVVSLLSSLLDEVYGQTPEENLTDIEYQPGSLHLKDNIVCNTSAKEDRPQQVIHDDSILNNTKIAVSEEPAIQLSNSSSERTAQDNKISVIYQDDPNLGKTLGEQEDCVRSECRPKETSQDPAETCSASTNLPPNYSPPSTANNTSGEDPDFKLNFSIFDDNFVLDSFDENAVPSALDTRKLGESDSVDHCTLDPMAKKEGNSPKNLDSTENIQLLGNSVSLTDWSKGRGLTDEDGKPLQPATLLIPGNTCTSDEGPRTNYSVHGQHSTNHIMPKPVSSNQMPSNSAAGANSHLITQNSIETSDSATTSSKKVTSPTNHETACLPKANKDRSPAKRRFFLEKKIGKGITYDLVGHSTVRRAQSAFAFFSKDVRPQVMEKNPKSSPIDIMKMVEEKWRQLEGREKEKYEEMGRKDVERYRNQLKAAQEKLSVGQEAREEASSRKKKKLNLPSNQGLIDKMLLSQQRRSANQSTESVTPDIPTVDVSFSLIGLRRELKTQNETRKTDQRLRLIGQLTSHGVWLALHGNQVVVFNQYRVEETLLNQRLMAHHVLPCQPVDVPIVLSPSMLGGDANWNTLLRLRSQSMPPDPAEYYTDERLTANGFEIKQTIDSETREVKVQVIAMTVAISYYGIGDLQEILELISTNPHVSLLECRPLKVANYLKGEAVRMVRNLPSTMQAEDIQDIIRRMKQLPDQCMTCLHNQPLEYPLYTVPECLT